MTMTGIDDMGKQHHSRSTAAAHGSRIQIFGMKRSLGRTGMKDVTRSRQELREKRHCRFGHIDLGGKREYLHMRPHISKQWVIVRQITITRAEQGDKRCGLAAAATPWDQDPAVMFLQRSRMDRIEFPLS